ncbi:RHS repeat-associated core domain-containing protein [Luteolibacter ambystomatis]|nr:RHS repeat-associated core domain-containing protein [Luteolibacter ambystomatis]
MLGCVGCDWVIFVTHGVLHPGGIFLVPDHAGTQLPEEKEMKIDHGNRFGRAVLAAGFMIPAGLSWAATTGSENYRYDASGNLVEKSIGGEVTHLAYDSTNRLLASGGNRFTYDQAGRLVSEHEATAGTSRQLQYGYGDKVVGVATDGTTTEFLYNAAGQLVGKARNGEVSSYVWDGICLVAEGDRAFANEAHVTGAVPILVSDGGVAISDYLGNTLVSGTQDFEATAYGKGQEAGRFTGKIYMQELGAYLFPYRWYSADTARWIGADPSGYPDGLNNFSYVNSDPLSRVDPLGLVTFNNPANTAAAGGASTSYSGPTETTAGTIKVREIAKEGDGGICYQPVVDQAFAYEAGSTMSLPTAGTTYLGYLRDATSVSGSTTHETWHRTIFETLLTKTYGKLETWSASYEGNEFATSAEALAAGNADFAAAKAAAEAKRAAEWPNRLINHAGAVSQQTTENGVDVWRSVNANWGTAANNHMAAITLNFTYTDGNCEH